MYLKNNLVPLFYSIILIVFFCVFFSLWCSTENINSNSEFVECDGVKFIVGNKNFYYVGTNCYYLMVYAADIDLRKYVDEVMEDAAAIGLKVIRT